jgi:hypothetical protein
MLPLQFSNVSGMVDSKVSIEQNRTIQKLTYLTIVYLPMGLLAVRPFRFQSPDNPIPLTFPSLGNFRNP